MIKAKRDELLAPLAAVSGIIERRHTLPILSNVLIDGSADTLIRPEAGRHTAAAEAPQVGRDHPIPI